MRARRTILIAMSLVLTACGGTAVNPGIGTDEGRPGLGDAHDLRQPSELRSDLAGGDVFAGDVPADSVGADWSDLSSSEGVVDSGPVGDTTTLYDVVDGGWHDQWELVDDAGHGDLPFVEDALEETTIDTYEPPPDGICQGYYPPWSRSEKGVGGTVVFTELMVSPGSDQSQWLELHNPFSIDFDLSGWSLAGDIGYTFPPGTMLSPGAYVVVGESGTELGPWEGTLSPVAGTVELFSNGGRLMDRIAYTTAHPWPVAPGGTGVSLAKRRPTDSSERAEHWRSSLVVGGTPGEANFADPLAEPEWASLVEEDAVWNYLDNGSDPGVGWASTDFDASAWGEGAAVFYAGGSPVVAEEMLARFTADNFFAMYVGPKDGSLLTYVGRDSVGNWNSAEEFALTVQPGEHLYVAGWEALGGDQGPQMLIGEVEGDAGNLLTSQSSFEWIIGPDGACPGGALSDPAPPVDTLQALIASGNAADSWAAPAVESPETSTPWGAQLAGQFAHGPNYIWSDTFGNLSNCNAQETYVLFRSTQPLVGTQGETELPEPSLTTWFRTEFTLPAEPEQLTIWLDASVDDGAVFYVNGIEVHRVNLPEGEIGALTPALSAVEEPLTVTGIQVPSSLLLDGANVLAVEVHQAVDGLDSLVFDAQLDAQVWPLDADQQDTGLRFNEVAPGGAGFWCELVNRNGQELPLDGVRVATTNGDLAVLDAGTLLAGELLVLPYDELGFVPEPGDLLYLATETGDAVLDAVVIGPDTMSRAEGQGAWFFPAAATPGEANLPFQMPPVVINEIMYHHAPVTGFDGALVQDEEEWLELFNAGDDEVDVSGWTLNDGITYGFDGGTVIGPGQYLVVARDALSFAAENPGLDVVGDFGGRLNNAGEGIVLRDGCGNVVDAVRYADGGRWPGAADGGGSTLELRDPWADNGSPGAWAASVEGAEGWQQVIIEDVVSKSSVGPDGQWQELVLGMVDDGTVLIDDISLLEDPEGAAVERIQNGTFDAGDATGWRLLGTHRHSSVVSDPDDPTNPVLRLVATGGAGHMHNHAETTLADGATIQNGVTYRLAFRARWVSGSNQLNSRLYFNRLARTTRLERPATNGTPGAPNSVLVDNQGPTFEELNHLPAVPGGDEPVTVTVRAADPDGVVATALWTSTDGGEPSATAMSELDGKWVAVLPGQPVGTVVHFWVEGTDGSGQTAFAPAKGPTARALYKVSGAPNPSGPMHTLRIIMTPDDEAWLHATPNLMSNDRIGCTVIWDEREVFYDVGVRLKGSERGRPKQPRLGFSLRFGSDEPFRGVFGTVMVDRSEGVGFGQREMLMNLFMARAGAASAKYSDLIHVVAPHEAHTGAAELQLTRFSDLMLANQFEGGADGDLYEYEYIYYPTTTDDGTPEGLKLPQPDSVVGTGVKSIGDSKEDYRFIYLPKNNRWRDSFDDIMTFAAFLGGSAPEIDADLDAYIDVDQWLQAFACSSLPGAVDHYGNNSGHNAMFYVRPEDKRVLYFPHDMDFFPGSPTNAVVANNDLKKILANPERKRLYYGYLLEIIQTAYNGDYMGHWCDQLGALLPAQNFAGHCSFIEQRAEYVLNGAADAVNKVIPDVEFAITTNGGNDFDTEQENLQLAGQAYLDVATVWLESGNAPLPLVWTDAGHWSVPVSLACGPNPVTLVARDKAGNAVGSDSIVLSLGGENCP